MAYYDDEHHDNRPVVADNSPLGPTVICAWHGSIFVIVPGDDTQRPSHGICATCKARLDAELDERAQGNQALVTRFQEPIGGGEVRASADPVAGYARVLAGGLDLLFGERQGELGGAHRE